MTGRTWRFAALGMVVTAALAAAPAAGPTAVAGEKATGGLTSRLPELKTWQLPNGLRVAYMGVHAAPVVSVQIWYRAGSKDDPAHRHGMAHMFDRMMFEGSEHVRPGQHARDIEALGGSATALTTQDATSFRETLPKQYLDFAVELEAERMRHLLLRKKMVAREREVAKGEIRRQRQRSPITRGLELFLKTAYKIHPYAFTSAGSIADIGKTKLPDLEKFYDAYYIPNNAMLVVVGDVSEAEVRTSANKWFGRVKAGPTPPRPAAAKREPPQRRMRYKRADPERVGAILAGYHIPSANSADVSPLLVLSAILSAGDSSRLRERLVRRDKVAVQAAAQAIVREDPGLFILFAVFLKEHDEPKVQADLLDEVARIAKRPPSARELEEAKNQLVSSFVFGLQSVSGIAEQVGNSWIQTGDPGHFLGALTRYEAVTARDVQRVAKKYLRRNKLTVVVIPAQGGAHARDKAGSKGK